MQRQYLSIDIGGTAIKSALIDHSGNIFEKKHLPTPHQEEEFLGALFQIINRHLTQIAAICISVPGIVNPHLGRVWFTGALGFMGQIDLASYLEKRVHRPVYVGNDANCATLAEMWLGNLNGIQNGAVITLGTSVGGGIVINDQLIHGPHFQAGELSAMIIDHDAPQLHYSTMGATTSAVKMIEAITTVCHLPDKTDGRQAFAKIKQHDPAAWPIFTSFCHRIAVLMLNMQTVVDLDRILIGGGISAQPILITEIKHQFNYLQAGDYRLRDDLTMPEIMPAKFGNEANLLGALYGLLLAIE